jgi:choline dehydrogenase
MKRETVLIIVAIVVAIVIILCLLRNRNDLPCQENEWERKKVRTSAPPLQDQRQRIQSARPNKSDFQKSKPAVNKSFKPVVKSSSTCSSSSSSSSSSSCPEGEESYAQEYHFPWADGAKCEPDFLFIGMGPSGCAALRKLADKGARVAALTTGWDNQEDEIVKYPFEVSQYQGKGQFGLNLINALFDPKTSVFEGNPSGSGEGWDYTGIWRGQGTGGGGNHYFADAVLPVDQDLDGPLPDLFIAPGDQVTMSLAEAGGPQWGSAVIKGLIKNELETFEAAAYLGGGPPLSENLSERGTSGPLYISQLSPAPAGDQLTMIEALSYAATQLNPAFNCGTMPIVEDINLEQNLAGVSQLQFFLHFNPDTGRIERQTAATAFLGRDSFAMNSKQDLVGKGPLKAYVKTNAYVFKIIIDKTSQGAVARGVLVMIDGKVRYVKAKNIILAAGASMTPRLLEVSGIGSSEILSEFNINPKVILPAVGNNLHTQYGSKCIFSTTDPDFQYNFYGQGFLGYKNVPRAFQFLHLGLGPQSYGHLLGGAPYVDPNLFYGLTDCFMLHPRSRGSLHITSDSLGDHPNLRYELFTDGPDPNDPSSGLSDDESDMFMACVALDYQYEVVKRLQTEYPAGNFNIVYPPLEVFEIPDQTERYAVYARYLPQLRGVAAHEAGTCVMNNDPALGVVDSNCQIHGTTNMYITDYSIFPAQISGNPSAGLMAAGLNAGNLIATQHGF